MATRKAAPGPSPKRRPHDWERIAVEYRAGIRSVREIAEEHGISHAAILKRAKAEEWPRDLKAKIKAKADALVTKALVTSEVAAETKITERLTVEVEAQVIARVQIAHRTDIGRSRKLVMTLLSELEHQTGSEDLYEQLHELVTAADGDAVTDAGRERQRKLREAYQRALGLSGRVKTMKDLADSLRVLVALEREAYSIGAEGGGSAGYEDLVSDLPEAQG